MKEEKLRKGWEEGVKLKHGEMADEASDWGLTRALGGKYEAVTGTHRRPLCSRYPVQ